MWGPVVLTHQDSGEGKFTGDEEGACVLWSPPKPPYHAEDTLSAPRPNSPGRLWFGLGGLGRRSMGGWALQRREKGECLENKGPLGELCLHQDRECLSHRGRCGRSDSG